MLNKRVALFKRDKRDFSVCLFIPLGEEEVIEEVVVTGSYIGGRLKMPSFLSMSSRKKICYSKVLRR